MNIQLLLFESISGDCDALVKTDGSIALALAASDNSFKRRVPVQSCLLMGVA
jgi:hypothetical protein